MSVARSLTQHKSVEDLKEIEEDKENQDVTLEHECINESSASRLPSPSGSKRTSINLAIHRVAKRPSGAERENGAAGAEHEEGQARRLTFDFGNDEEEELLYGETPLSNDEPLLEKKQLAAVERAALNQA